MPRITKKQISEAARVLKSKSSKKKERKEAASLLSNFGSSKGGINRARNLTPEQRSEIARMGGLKRQALAREARAAQEAKRAKRASARATA